MFFQTSFFYALDTEELLLKLETGLEMTFDRAKILSKYLGELISYVKKKASLGKQACCGQ